QPVRLFKRLWIDCDDRIDGRPLLVVRVDTFEIQLDESGLRIARFTPRRDGISGGTIHRGDAERACDDVLLVHYGHHRTKTVGDEAANATESDGIAGSHYTSDRRAAGSPKHIPGCYWQP